MLSSPTPADLSLYHRADYPALTYSTRIRGNSRVVLNLFLNASMMTDDVNIMTALYSASGVIEPVEILPVLSIHLRTCEVNSYKIMFLIATYFMTELFEFREGYITSAMVSVDMCEILYISWEQDNKI